MRRIIVPATTANLGSGYDILGMALNLYNVFEVAKIDKGIEIIGDVDVPLEENIVYRVIKKTMGLYGKKADGVSINFKEINIPQSRGLGSSAACIVAGVYIANYLMGDQMTEKEIVKIATEIEGHPDNIVPAVIGGLTISIDDDRDIIYSKTKVPGNLQFVAMIPDFKTSTDDSRNLIPKEISIKKHIYNASRLGLLISAMNNGEIEYLREATQDKIHQEHRSKCIPDIEGIFKKSIEFGSKAEFISGSGPTLLAIVEKNDEVYKMKLELFLKSLKQNWKVLLLDVEQNGVKFENIKDERTEVV